MGIYYDYKNVLALCVLLMCTACSTHIVKTDDTYRFKGESSVSLTNKGTLYVKDAQLDTNGLTARDYYTDAPINLPRSYISSVTDIDYWRGAKYGAFILPAVSFIALNATMAPETHNDFTLPNALRPDPCFARARAAL